MRSHQINSVRRFILLLFLSINYGDLVYAESDCNNTIYIMPLFDRTTSPSEFVNVQNYLNECQMKAFKEDMRGRIEVLSLSSNSKLVECNVGECSNVLNKTIDPSKFILQQ